MNNEKLLQGARNETECCTLDEKKIKLHFIIDSLASVLTCGKTTVIGWGSFIILKMSGQANSLVTIGNRSSQLNTLYLITRAWPKYFGRLGLTNDFHLHNDHPYSFDINPLITYYYNIVLCTRSCRQVRYTHSRLLYQRHESQN